MEELQKVFSKRKIDKDEGNRLAGALKVRATNYFQKLPEKGAKEKRETGPAEPRREGERASASAILEENEKAGDDKAEDGGYIVSVSKRGSRVLLHKRVGCWRTVQMAFGDYFVLEAGAVPKAADFTGFCQDCWRDEAPPFDLTSSPSGSAASSSSSTS